jgi:hypothetical protein
MPMAMEIGLVFLAPLSKLENCLLLVMMLMLTPFLGTCPGWQNKMAVCGLQDELPMRIVADKGKVERD